MEDRRERLVARSWWIVDSNKAARQRLDLLRSMNHASRAFAETMRTTAAERKRFTEERERILERERMARAEAEASRERLREVLESIDDAFFALDQRWRFTYVNDRAVEFAGRPREELIGKSVLEAFPELVGGAASAELIRAEKEATQFEHYSPRLGRWLHYRAYPSQSGLSIYATDVTGFKEAQEALRQSEERYRSLVTATSSIVWTAAGTGEIAEDMPTWQEFTGQTPEEYEGSGWLDAVHPDDRQRVAEEWDLALQNKTPVEVSYRLLRHDGQHRHVISRGVPILDQNDDIREWVGTVIDVHDQRRAEEALRETEAKLMGLFRSDVVGIAWGEEELILECNDESLRMMGYTREDLLDGGLNWNEMTPPEERERSAQAVQEAIETGRFAPFEKNFIRKDGSRIPTILGGYCLGTDPFRYVSFILDISEHKETEEKLRESEERYRALYEDNPSMYFTLDAEGRVLSVNRFGAEQLSYAVEEVVGRPISDLFHEEDREGASRHFSACLRDPERIGAWEFRKVRKDGSTLWVRENARVVRRPDGSTNVLVACEDITERKKAEEERERFLAREWRTHAEAGERKRISRELHDRVAHSMAVVHQSLELYEALKERKPSQAKAKMELARKMAREALDSTRNLSRELRDPEVEDSFSSALSNLLESAVPPGLERGISVEGDESLVPPHVREQLFLILREGVRNAVSHSGADRLRIGVEIGPDRVVGTVEDDGRGFAEGDGSTGHGLRSMRERAELVGGTLGLFSTPDAGTTIKASIPLKGDATGETGSPNEGR